MHPAGLSVNKASTANILLDTGIQTIKLTFNPPNTVPVHKSMKKLLIFILAIALLGFASYAGYRFYLPSMIAATLTSEKPSRLIPAEMQEKVKNLRLKIDREIEDLPVLLKETRLTVDDLLIMIDRANPDQFARAIEEMKNTRLTSTNQIFDICMKHIKIGGYDLEVFRGPFVQHTSVRNIQEAIGKIEQNELITSMGIPVLKETAKQILISSKEEILEKMNQ